MPEWFENWFDSPYYHILYDHRDQAEADAFLKRLSSMCEWPHNHSILDLGCGAGRHCEALAQLGYHMTGVDLSPQSIQSAKTRKIPEAEFYVADMRTFDLPKKFDVAMNLFTSFGYFDEESENLQVLNQIHKHLVNGGQLIIDFLNPDSVIAGLVPRESVVKGGVSFEISREVTGGHVVKKISVTNDGEDYEFQERVQLFDAADFERLLKASGFSVEKVLGSYDLDDFSAFSSRQIIIARRE